MTTAMLVKEALKKYHEEGIIDALGGGFRLAHCGDGNGRGVVVLYAPLEALELFRTIYTELTGEPAADKETVRLEPGAN